jgi:hypothetical protein
MSDQSSHEPSRSAEGPADRKASRSWRAALAFLAIASTYFLMAYIIVPLVWLGYEVRHPAIDETPGITTTSDDHPGDPINVALIGSEADVRRAMLAAGWFPADPLGIKSDLEIAAGTVLERPYDTAPVSDLYLWGRKEDLAFEQPVGDDPRQRHHVRFWKSAKLDSNAQPAWMGSASYDKKVGLSHTTGQITHHISADVDTERDHVIESLKPTGELVSVQVVDSFHKILEGRNGGGDAWHTDGRLFTGILKQVASQ